MPPEIHFMGKIRMASSYQFKHLAQLRSPLFSLNPTCTISNKLSPPLVQKFLAVEESNFKTSRGIREMIILLFRFIFLLKYHYIIQNLSYFALIFFGYYCVSQILTISFCSATVISYCHVNIISHFIQLLEQISSQIRNIS